MTERIARLAIARLAIGAASALAVVGCHGKANDAPPPAQAPETPAAEPEGLIVEGTFATPDATWQRVQRGVGGAAGILPSTLGGMIGAAFGIDPGLGAEIDGTSGAYVVAAGDLAAPAWVVAMRLTDARRATALVEGETSRFDARAAGDFEVLVPKGESSGGGGRRGSPARPVAAIARGKGWFVLARSEDDLAKLAPYATRTLPTRPATRDAITFDVPGSALAGTWRSRIAREWDDAKKQMLASDDALRAQHGGRAPDFGDPTAIVARLDALMQGRLAVLSDLKGAHVAITPTDNDLRAVLTAIPASAGGPASQVIAGVHPGDAAPLRQVTRDAAFALLVRDAGGTRAKDATDLEASIDAALGPRLAAADAKRLHAAIDDWSAGRGDAWTLAVDWGESARGLVLDAQATDPARVSRAVHEGIDALMHVPALHDPVTTWLGVRDAAFGAADLPGGGHATTATFAWAAPTRAASPPYVVGWAPGAGDVKLALSETPLPLLSPVPSGQTLGDDPAIRALTDALGEVVGALVLQPGRSPACDKVPGGVAVGWGTREVDGAPAMWGEAVASFSSARCLAKSAF